MRPITLPCLGLMLAAIAVATCAAEPTENAKQKPRVLFVGKSIDHPFGTHMYLHTCKVLAKCLENHNVEAVVSNGWPEDESDLIGIRSIVVYTSPGAELLLDGPHRDQVATLMNQGVGLVTIHWASSIYQANLDRLGPAWISYLGGTWVSNVGLHTGKSQLKQLTPAHPVCRGWQEYELHDEYYLNPTIKDASPVLEVAAKGEPVVVGWAYERPQGGKSFATTLGHFYRNFQQEPFRRMIVNAILWTSDVEVPLAGANVTLTDTDLALPVVP